MTPAQREALQLERLMVEQFGEDFRDKVLVGPMGSWPLADCFEECGLEDPRRPRRCESLSVGLFQTMPPRPFAFPRRPAAELGAWDAYRRRSH